METEEDIVYKNNLPYCKKCGGARFFLDDAGNAHRTFCECAKKDFDDKQKKLEEEKRLVKFRSNQKLSLMGERYKNAFFSSARIIDENKEQYKRCINYCKKSDLVLKNNIGLYIYGDNSSGKTHLSACMCNDLIMQGYNCIFTNISSIITEINNNYKYTNNNMNIISYLNSADFVFIDDIGQEFLAREFNAGTSSYAERLFGEILDSRCSAKKPVIFTSNFSIAELLDKLHISKRSVERINSLCARVIKLEGHNFRDDELTERQNLLKKIGL